METKCTEPMAILRINRTFRQGLRSKSIYFNPSIFDKDATTIFRIGYWIWGMDIWIGRVPMIKIMIGVNIIMWFVIS
jgi:hypothetical protein